VRRGRTLRTSKHEKPRDIDSLSSSRGFFY